MGKEKPSTKKCKYCQTEIDAKAKVCPVCKRTLKSHGCLAGIFSIIIVFTGIFVLSTAMNDGIQKEVSGVSDKSEYITLDEYNQVDTGMTYEEVQDIIGGAGTISSQVESNGYKIVIVTWYGNGTAGSNANVTFTNNSVSGKAQVGLK
ncbi:DUF3862 domain-containing protein [Lacrimispora sp.]|uniref:DUF3862 domain-containing protein n=1 Tax=Lacrimispora sp. TaxID=2719234 RepID=UPI00345F28DE